ncbi:MAG: Stk1 family PASTA domain-containing Ser/Thr kinase [Rubrobacter sp.]|nr:Stk1 family PASTA domain-containing Ser/Thr kinase [Rubrobacter sp.]
MQGTVMDNRYTLTGRLGGGGMAEVYLARDGVLDREVALKVLRGQFSEDDDFVQRFQREARSAAGLSHPNIVQVYDQGRAEDGTYYMAIEYVSGGTLKERIVEQGALSPAEAVGVAQKVAEALDVAHHRGIVHRDIKPQNVLLTPKGEAKVADFGIARAASATVVTQTNLVLGTAGYMSPEQAIGERVEPPSDLYSLGVVLYEMLTGALPYEADTPIGVAMQHINAPPRSPREANPEVPEDLDAITVRLLSKDPQDRYPSADALARDLERVKNGLPPVVAPVPAATAQTRVAPSPPPVPPPVASGAGGRRRRGGMLPVFLALVAALLLLAGVAWALTGGLGVGDGAGGGGGQVEVPDVEGQRLDEARNDLEQAGFEVDVERRESAAGDDGVVLDQSVNGGDRARRGSPIALTVGEGPSSVAVPDIPYGATPDEAQAQLEEAGLKLGDQSEASSDTVAEGGVVLQDPLPDVEVESGTAVDITLSTGPAAAPEQAPATEDPVQDPAQAPTSEEPSTETPTEEAVPQEAAPSEATPQEAAPSEGSGAGAAGEKAPKTPKPAPGGEAGEVVDEVREEVREELPKEED